jgi:hypothetical protein
LLAERIDLELNAICNAYRNRRFCLFDTLRLVERDWDGTRTIIAKDVHDRVLLAHAIVIQGGVQPTSVEGFAHVQCGISSRRMLHFGSHKPRRIETRLTTDVQRDFVRPMAEHVAAGLVAKGVQPRDGWHTVCHSEGTCTCWDFTYRGPARAGCKHLAAYHLDHHARDGTADDGLVQAASIRDLAREIRERERRVPRPLQVQDVLSDSDLAVWGFLRPLALSAGARQQAAAAPASGEEQAAAAPVLLPEGEDRAEHRSDEWAAVDTAAQAEGSEALAKKKKKKKAKRKAQPPSSYMLFCADTRPKVKAEAQGQGRGNAAKELTFGEISKIVGERWKGLSDRQKGTWATKAEKAAQAFRVAQHADDEEEEDKAAGGARAGPPKAIEPKARHRWRGSADAQRPLFGLRDRDLSGSGGASALLRVDAGKAGRVSRMSRAAAKAPPQPATKATSEAAAAAATGTAISAGGKEVAPMVVDEAAKGGEVAWPMRRGVAVD